VTEQSRNPAAVALGLGTLAALAIAWEIAVQSGALDRYIVPPPSEILAALPRVAVEEDVAGRFLLTMGEAMAAVLLLAAVGVPVAVLLYFKRVLQEAVHSWVAALAAAPVVLMYPLFLVIFGRSAATIIAIAFAAALPAVILKALEGLLATPPVLLRVGDSLGLSRAQSFAKILFPSALPTIFVGLRLGLVFALVNIVGVEFLINFGGLGQLVNELAERYDLAGTYAAIVYVILVSVFVFALTAKVEQWARRAQ
jgi:ABC-type nitrate/sulfonate/bicarbonate transport system permease component